MPGHLQEGFGCVVTNRFDQLLDDESDPFEILKAAENKKKDAAASGGSKTAAQAAKQPKKESQKDRKNTAQDKKEDTQAPVPLKKEGMFKFQHHMYAVCQNITAFLHIMHKLKVINSVLCTKSAHANSLKAHPKTCIVYVGDSVGYRYERLCAYKHSSKGIMELLLSTFSDL